MALMELNKKEQEIRKQLYFIGGATFAVLYSLLCFVISPIYVSVIYNIAYDGTALPDFLNYLGNFTEILASAVFYGVLCYIIYRFGAYFCRKAILIFAGANLYKYTASAIMGWVSDGSVPRYWYIELLTAIYYTLLELVTFAIVWFIIKMIADESRKEQRIPRYTRQEAFPILNMLDLKNSLVRASFFSAVAILSVKIVIKVLNDVITVSKITNVWLMLVSYFSNVLFAVVSFFVMIFVLMIINDKMTKLNGQELE